jgi:hypothetical protein
MSGIGIIGTGISGIQLALCLQAKGIESSVYSARSVEEHRAGRLPNCVMRWAPTVERERSLGVYHHADNEVHAVHVRVEGEAPLAFCGLLPAAANTTDFRLYLPALLEDYLDRGGSLVVGPCGPEDLPALASRHELLVVAAGRDGFSGVFPRDPLRSPHQEPPRHITAGLYRGVRWPEPPGAAFSIIPGLGEVFQVSFHSFDGPISAIAVEGLPGSPLAALSTLDHHDDPAGFHRAVLEVLRDHAPALHDRIDTTTFGLARPLDLLQGQITPTVRQAWTHLDDGTHAIAIGDAWITHDPIAAQGANLGSRCAFLLAEAIAADGPYDDQFCRRTEHEMWQAAEAPTILSNALLEPPGPEVITVLVDACGDQAAADRFAAGFGDPETLLASFTAPASPVMRT